MRPFVFAHKKCNKICCLDLFSEVSEEWPPNECDSFVDIDCLILFIDKLAMEM